MRYIFRSRVFWTLAALPVLYITALLAQMDIFRDQFWSFVAVSFGVPALLWGTVVFTFLRNQPSFWTHVTYWGTFTMIGAVYGGMLFISETGDKHRKIEPTILQVAPVPAVPAEQSSGYSKSTCTKDAATGTWRCVNADGSVNQQLSETAGRLKR